MSPPLPRSRKQPQPAQTRCWACCDVMSRGLYLCRLCGLAFCSSHCLDWHTKMTHERNPPWLKKKPPAPASRVPPESQG
jgi:hypothetical protein